MEPMDIQTKTFAWVPLAILGIIGVPLAMILILVFIVQVRL